MARSAPNRPPSARRASRADRRRGPLSGTSARARQWSRADPAIHGRLYRVRYDPLARLAPRLTEEASTLTTFRDLGILPETAEALEAVGIIVPVPHPRDDAPGRPLGHRRHRPGQDRHRQDARFRPPAAGARHRPRGRRGGPGQARPATDAPQALVVVPTRELCQQVTNDLLTAGKVRNVRVLAIYGGRAYEPQVEALKKGVDVDRRHPGPPARPRGPEEAATSRTSGRSSSTRPTRCSTWASCPTSRRSSSCCRPSARRCCSRRRCRARSSASPAATCRSPRTSAPPRRTTRARPSRTPRSTSSAPTPWTSRRWSRASCRPRAAGWR